MDKLYTRRVRQDILAVYETLVRHDENIAALTFIEECVPWFLREDPLVRTHQSHQRRWTEHLRDPGVYAEYYGNNPHELPWEEMFGCTVEEISSTYSRVRWLRDRLIDAEVKTAFDLACNDGAIALHLMQQIPGLHVQGFDLNRTCVERAYARGVDAQWGDILRLPEQEYRQAVIAMEVIEHVPDPVALLRKCSELGTLIYITCPLGSTDPARDDWMTEEYKGHVRAVTPNDILKWSREASLIVRDISIADGHTICAELDT